MGRAIFNKKYRGLCHRDSGMYVNILSFGFNFNSGIGEHINLEEFGQVRTRGGRGHSHILAIRVCAAVRLPLSRCPIQETGAQKPFSEQATVL